MRTIVAKTAGFCFGVERAVSLAYERAEKENCPIYTLGPIIHNEQVVNDLAAHGVHAVSTIKELESLPKGLLIIRSHGVGQAIYHALDQMQYPYEDATCPFVRKIHKIVKEQSSMGRRIVVIGDAEHPEVQGIVGWSSTPCVVINSQSEAEAFFLPENTKLCIVSQTTFNYNKFQELVEILGKKGYDRCVMNTICNATEERQKEARAIASEVDAMLVIGGKHSSNTQKLYEICKKECVNTYHIQTLVDLDFDLIQSNRCVGITAGASTPKKIIEEVSKQCLK